MSSPLACHVALSFSALGARGAPPHPLLPSPGRTRRPRDTPQHTLLYCLTCWRGAGTSCNPSRPTPKGNSPTCLKRTGSTHKYHPVACDFQSAQQESRRARAGHAGPAPFRGDLGVEGPHCSVSDFQLWREAGEPLSAAQEDKAQGDRDPSRNCPLRSVPTLSIALLLTKVASPWAVFFLSFFFLVCNIPLS